MKNFNYKKFSENMTQQAINLIPKDISKESADYLIITISTKTITK